MKNVLQCQVRHLFQAAYRGASAKMLASAESGDLNPLFEILSRTVFEASTQFQLSVVAESIAIEIKASSAGECINL
jgi:hypothetical protein